MCFKESIGNEFPLKQTHPEHHRRPLPNHLRHPRARFSGTFTGSFPSAGQPRFRECGALEVARPETSPITGRQAQALTVTLFDRLNISGSCTPWPPGFLLPVGGRTAKDGDVAR